MLKTKVSKGETSDTLGIQREDGKKQKERVELPDIGVKVGGTTRNLCKKKELRWEVEKD